MRYLFFLLLLFPFIKGISQSTDTIRLLTKGEPTSLRGISVVDRATVWVSGSNGRIGRSTDGGETWQWKSISGHEKRDFRDIHAFSINTAVVMAVDTPALIFRTTDGGESWKKVFEDKRTGMFLDALTFWNDKAGIVVGDPIDGHVFIARSFDGGASWQTLPPQLCPMLLPGEAMFAASGTNVQPLDRDEAAFVTGGAQSRVFLRDRSILIPIYSLAKSAGANSLTVWDNRKRKGGKRLMVAGGDFNQPGIDTSNLVYTVNAGKAWQKPVVPPRGYRSCVAYTSKSAAITCGITGADISFDGGANWRSISALGFHTLGIDPARSVVYFAGGGGRIGKWTILQNIKR